ncbi:MAG: peroxide stress protein YaaA [Coriobacteriia bacterium]|nr:peroxide stress protein YaaA [Coriobacteriia bacterium]
MRIIISPAKQMVTDDLTTGPTGTPVFLDQARRILEHLQVLTYDQAKALWGCSEKLAQMNFARLQDLDLERNLTPAVLAFDGIAFKYMAPSVFEDGQFDYVQEHLRILSGFYGALRPLDGVVPYRLEMQSKAAIDGARDLYELWGDRIYQQVLDGDRVVVNLASKEYSKCVERYLQPQDRLVTCVFGELTDAGKVVQKGVYAKMARGDMVRFMAENNVTDPAGMQAYDRLGYRFSPERSTESQYVFLKDPSA